MDGFKTAVIQKNFFELEPQHHDTQNMKRCPLLSSCELRTPTVEYITTHMHKDECIQDECNEYQNCWQPPKPYIQESAAPANTGE